MKKSRPIYKVVVYFAVLTIMTGCTIEGEDTDPYAHLRQVNLKHDSGVIPIARIVDGEPKLLKSGEEYWGLFRKNYNEDDPSRMEFRIEEGHAVRAIQSWHHGRGAYTWQLAAEAYSHKQQLDVFMRLELGLDGDLLVLPKSDQNAFHLYYCDPEDNNDPCQLVVDAGGDIKGCYRAGAPIAKENKCNLTHREINPF